MSGSRPCSGLPLHWKSALGHCSTDSRESRSSVPPCSTGPRDEPVVLAIGNPELTKAVHHLVATVRRDLQEPLPEQRWAYDTQACDGGGDRADHPFLGVFGPVALGESSDLVGVERF